MSYHNLCDSKTGSQLLCHHYLINYAINYIPLCYIYVRTNEGVNTWIFPRIEKMGVLGLPRLVAIAVGLGLFLNATVLCNGGRTSTFVRKLEESEDMPLDSDVFQLPSGYNAPQQVKHLQHKLFLIFLLLLILKTSKASSVCLFILYARFISLDNCKHLVCFLHFKILVLLL